MWPGSLGRRRRRRRAHTIQAAHVFVIARRANQNHCRFRRRTICIARERQLSKPRLVAKTANRAYKVLQPEFSREPSDEIEDYGLRRRAPVYTEAQRRSRKPILSMDGVVPTATTTYEATL